MTLPDDLVVYPPDGGWVALWAEYAGRAFVDDRNGVADQLRIADPAWNQFIRELASNFPARPENFLKDEQVNRQCDDAGGNAQI